MKYAKPTYENEIFDVCDVVAASKIEFENGVILVEKEKDEAQVGVNVFDLLGFR